MPVFTLTARVIHGEHVGRTIHTPTINLDALPQDPTIRLGVYAAQCCIQGKLLPALAYLGPRLIFQETKVCCEAHLYGFHGDAYGEKVTLTGHVWLRDPLPFSTLGALQEQLEQDKIQGEARLRTLGLWESLPCPLPPSNSSPTSPMPA